MLIVYSVKYIVYLTFRFGSPRQSSHKRQRASEDIPVSLASVARVDDIKAIKSRNGDLLWSQYVEYARKAVKVRKQARRSARPTIPATASL